MKSFLDLLQEDKSGDVHHVMAFGRMNPPTTGHLKVIDKVKEVAAKHNAGHTVVTSHSQDKNKNPLSAAQKIKHLKRYSPGTNFEASNKEHPSFLHHAAKLHKQGVTHLHMVVGSDRVAEVKEKLNKYNGTHPGALYNFKKIHVHSAGQRDPDSEGTAGMSGTKMREHAKHKDIKSFRQGVPSHVSDSHAKELMHDTRTGMGIHESSYHGLFKAIFVTGGPGSGKDVVIRESIPHQGAVEINSVQAFEYLMDKQKLSETTKDYRREAIRSRLPLIINGPADDHYRMITIKEELEELGYETMIVFVDTTNEASKQRNERLTKMVSESVRQEKWQLAQSSKESYRQNFERFVNFDNSESLESIQEGITHTYQKVDNFFAGESYTETANMWLENHVPLNIGSYNSLFKENENVKKNSRFVQRFNESKSIKLRKGGSPAAAGPGDISPDNRPGDPNADNIKWDGRKPRSSYIFRTYSEENKPSIQVFPASKESNFSQDKDKVNRKKYGDKSLKDSRIQSTDGVGATWNTRTNGSGLTGGAGLGNPLSSESIDYSNASPASTAMPSGGSVNPLSNSYDTFKKFRKTIKKEAIDDPGANDMGVGGTLGGATNKEPMENPKDKMGFSYDIKKKKKK
jgi:predicted kinase